MVCTDTTPSSAEEMTTEMMDANHALRYGSSPIAKHNHAFLPAPPLPSALGPLSFSPVATNKHRMEVPTLKFDSPPPAFPGELGLDANNLSIDGSSALSNKLLHEAFASLSLTDKCALTLSMGQLNADGSKKLVPGSSATSNVPSATGTPRALSKSANLNMLGTSLDSSLLTASATGEEISEMQSVLSETDQESLHKAMSMMRHSELEQVEAEVENFLVVFVLSLHASNLFLLFACTTGAHYSKQLACLDASQELHQLARSRTRAARCLAREKEKCLGTSHLCPHRESSRSSLHARSQCRARSSHASIHRFRQFG